MEIKLPESRKRMLDVGVKQLRSARRNLLGVGLPIEVEDDLNETLTAQIGVLRKIVDECVVTKKNGEESVATEDTPDLTSEEIAELEASDGAELLGQLEKSKSLINSELKKLGTDVEDAVNPALSIADQVRARIAKQKASA